MLPGLGLPGMGLLQLGLPDLGLPGMGLPGWILHGLCPGWLPGSNVVGWGAAAVGGFPMSWGNDAQYAMPHEGHDLHVVRWSS